jgi:alpha-glucosidase
MKPSLLLLLSLICLNSFAQNARLSEQAGNVRKTATLPHGMAFELSNGYAELTVFSPSAIRVRVGRTRFNSDRSYAVESLAAGGNFNKITKEGNQSVLWTDSLKVVVSHEPFRVSFYNLKNVLLSGDDQSLGISWWGNQVTSYRKMHPDEKFIGLGEKTGNINRRGQFFRNWNSDIPAYALNQDPLYSTIPFFMAIHDSVCYGIFFDNTHHSFFNFGGGADEELYQFGADDGEMNYYFFGASNPAGILSDYTALTGRTPMPPIWSLGFQQCRWGYANENELLNIARTFRDKKLPADVVYMDITYMDHYKVFTWDPVNFPDPARMVSELKKMNFDLVTIIDPGIKVEPGYKAYEQGMAKDYFVKYPDGRKYTGHVWPGKCHFPDFTKPATRDWWGGLFKASHTDIGVRGFWNDMNEPAAWGREFPNLVEFGDAGNKATLYTVKNAYGLLMARSTYEGARKLMNGQRPFVLTRASYSGIQKYSAQWTGDNFASDEHMLLGQRLLNSMGLSGIPFVGMDVGGFMGDASPELYVRWMNLGIYSPLFRQHSSIDTRYHEPWQFGEANTRFVRRLLEQRYRLMPYLYSSFYQAHATGIPIDRMLPLKYTFEEKVYQDRYSNEFLFGDNMLVCPADSKTFSLDAYLPGAGTKWYRMGTDQVFAGGQSHFVPSPLDNLPVFIKEGAIIPMQSVVQSTKEKNDGVLYLHVWKGNADNSFSLYEDDGNSYDYEKGSFSLRTITYQPSAGSITISEKQGNYSSPFRKIRLMLHGFENASFSVNGNKTASTVSENIVAVELDNSNASIRVEWK